MPAYEVLLARQRSDSFAAHLRGIKRLRWPASKLAEYRQQRLRTLLSSAASNSPFWRKRLATVDISTFREADLWRLPILTKSQLVEHFDHIATRPEISLTRVERHLRQLDDGDAYLDDRYRVVVTSGSSGAQAVFVYDWDEWVEFVVVSNRWRQHLPALPEGPTVSLFAANPKHVSGALHAFGVGSHDAANRVHLPASLPIAQLLEGVQNADPKTIIGYPSMVGALAQQSIAGNLNIAPTHIETCGETCTDQIRKQARSAWNVEIMDYWGCTEGAWALPCSRDLGLHLPDDAIIVEPVDDDGYPVPSGEPAARLLITNLYNLTQPLIRYELSDALTITEEPCECGSAHRRILKIEGKRDGYFFYGDGAVVHGLGMESILLGRPGLLAFQVTQTEDGAVVSLVDDGHTDVAAIELDMRNLLAGSGVSKPHVEVCRVSTLERLWSGKLQKFQPLPDAETNSE